MQVPYKGEERTGFGPDRRIHLSRHFPPKSNEGDLGGHAPLRIVIAERDSMTADLLARALERESHGLVSTVSPDQLESALAGADERLAVISAEFHDDGLSGFDLAKAITRKEPAIQVVLILNRSTPASVIHAFRCGARGVVTRDQPITVFLGCIEHVRRGYIWVGGREAQFLLEGIRSIPASDLVMADSGARLTDREMQVVQCAAAGKTNKSDCGGTAPERAYRQELSVSRL